MGTGDERETSNASDRVGVGKLTLQWSGSRHGGILASIMAPTGVLIP